MIKTTNLTKRYGRLTAVDDISFTVEPGEVLGFLGPNGAGKSTTMKLIAGFLAPTSGSVSVFGCDVETDPIGSKSKIGYLPEGAPSYSEMTPVQFLDFIADVRGLDAGRKRERLAEVIGQLHLEKVLDQRIETLSKGFKRRVGLAQAIIHDPQVLILDEPTDGLDPNQKHEVRSLIRAIAADKIIVISTHILEEVHAVCTRAIVIARGRILADDTPTALEARSRYHNAVTIRLATGANMDLIRTQLAAMPQVKSVELVEHERSLTAFPRDGEQVLTAVSRIAAQDSWDVEELQLESGRLDEVFRTITTGQTGGGAVVSQIRTIFRREFLSYFSTPVAYVFIVIFLIMTGAFTFTIGGFYERGQADLSPFFSFHPWLYLFLVPALSMRLWAEERKSGTIELLLTMPVTMIQAVAGKFLAAWAFTGIALALTFPIWLTVNYLGDPDNGVILAAYVGSLLMSGGFLAIGACLSAATRNQVIAFILTVVVCFGFLLSGLPIVQGFFSLWAPQAIIDAVASLSFMTHFQSISKGVIDLRDIVYFGLVIGFWLVANAIVLDAKKAD